MRSLSLSLFLYIKVFYSDLIRLYQSSQSAGPVSCHRLLHHVDSWIGSGYVNSLTELLEILFLKLLIKNCQLPIFLQPKSLGSKTGLAAEPVIQGPWQAEAGGWIGRSTSHSPRLYNLKTLSQPKEGGETGVSGGCPPSKRKALPPRSSTTTRQKILPKDTLGRRD